MFELTSGAAGLACGLLAVAVLLLLGYSLWARLSDWRDRPTGDRGAPPHGPLEPAPAVAPATQPVR